MGWKDLMKNVTDKATSIITIVTTMLKLVIQHRGQVQKGKKDV